MLITLQKLKQSLLIASFEKSVIQKHSLSRTPIKVRVSGGDGIEMPKSFEVVPLLKFDGTGRQVIKWIIPSSIGDIDVTEDIVA